MARNIFKDYFRPGVDSRVDNRVLNAITNAFKNVGQSLTGRVKSGFRSPSRNKAAGGAKRSQHMQGLAVDIDVRDLSIAERKDLIEALSAQGITGIGVYKNTIHADIGPRRSWGPSYGRKSVPSWASDVISKHLKAEFGQAPLISAATAPLPEAKPLDLAAALQPIDITTTLPASAPTGFEDGVPQILTAPMALPPMVFDMPPAGPTLFDDSPPQITTDPGPPLSEFPARPEYVGALPSAPLLSDFPARPEIAGALPAAPTVPDAYKDFLSSGIINWGDAPVLAPTPQERPPQTDFMARPEYPGSLPPGAPSIPQARPETTQLTQADLAISMPPSVPMARPEPTLAQSGMPGFGDQTAREVVGAALAQQDESAPLPNERPQVIQANLPMMDFTAPQLGLSPYDDSPPQISKGGEQMGYNIGGNFNPFDAPMVASSLGTTSTPKGDFEGVPTYSPEMFSQQVMGASNEPFVGDPSVLAGAPQMQAAPEPAPGPLSLYDMDMFGLQNMDAVDALSTELSVANAPTLAPPTIEAAPPVPPTEIAPAPPPTAPPPAPKLSLANLLNKAPKLQDIKTALGDAASAAITAIATNPDQFASNAIQNALNRGASPAQAAAEGRRARETAQPRLYGGPQSGTSQAVQSYNEYQDLKEAGYF